jgi:spermidine/putrescine transport system ATP-binding protein
MGYAPRTMAGGEVQLVDLVKRFGEFTAVAGINLDMPPGEFFSLLGPSGCGKTTTLRMIAGFEKPSEGQILLDGVDMSHTPPHKRNVNTVFQNYALFPHLDVGDNVAFGLKYQKDVSKQETKDRVGRALELVQMSQFATRRPSQLSGGQQQRVALARALILNPSVLLLDEPLGALDAKLRKRLQIELKALQEEVGITFIYVTHDQEEALTMSDRIAVMSQGWVEQVGPPKEIYEEPATAYVADFLGVSNLMGASAHGLGDGGCRVRLGEFDLVAGQGEADTRGPSKITIRPERVDLEPQGTTGLNRIPGMVERVVYVGSVLQVIVHLASGQTIQAWQQNEGVGATAHSGSAVTVHLPAEALRVLPEGGTAVMESGELEDP